MSTIRDSILLAIAARIQEAQASWDVQVRDASNKGTFPMAVVYFVGEDKRGAGNDSYGCSLPFAIDIHGAPEDATEADDGSNAFRYLDRLVGMAEAAMHAPDSWGVDPGFTDLVIDGHDVAEISDEDQSVSALLRLTVTYQHSLSGPQA